MKRTVITAILLGTPVAAIAAGMGANIPLMKPAPVGPGTVAIATDAISGGVYAVDPAHTLVGFRVNHVGFNDYFGLFGDVTGSLEFDPARPEAAAVSVSVPLTGLTTANADLSKHMHTADFFDTQTYPVVTFRSTGVKKTGATTADIAGDLTIRGVTKPVTLHAEFTGAGIMPMKEVETIGFEATALIKRSDFGMNFGLDMVSDEVALDITAAFEKQ